MELERIYLTKTAIGKGIGRALVQLTLEVARENNKATIWLKAMDTSHEAIAFYSKMGFEAIDTHRLKHPLMKEELKGMFIMKRAV